jgi:hypothetical protein
VDAGRGGLPGWLSSATTDIITSAICAWIVIGDQGW